MSEFTPWLSIAGGGLIGLAAVLLMAFHGHIADISEILQSLMPPAAKDWSWRAAFLCGAILIIGIPGWPPISSPCPNGMVGD